MKRNITLGLTALAVTLAFTGLALMFAPQSAGAAQRHGAPIRKPHALVALAPQHLATITMGAYEYHTQQLAGCLGSGDSRVPQGVTSVRVNYTFNASSGSYVQSWPAHSSQTASLAQVFGVTSNAVAMDVNVSPNGVGDACSGAATFAAQGLPSGTTGALDLTVIGYTP